ncbi:MAG: hypothetical protein FWB96_00200 [Defluviitaleaceae bacterium]|nr:hypothetical protein [Defluviitaleaceae bacterium]MCL2262537.1 hypothetical protein [Defluviitaleaceae bacterium]
MGEIIISGNGKDAGDEKKMYTMIVVGGIILLVVAFVFIGILTDYHTVRVFPTEIVRGIRFDNRVVSGWSIMLIVFGGTLSVVAVLIESQRPRFNSKIDVYEAVVCGKSRTKEEFELKYSEISSVTTKDDNGAKSISINVGGKTHQVYTSKAKEIATEINQRRNA